MYVHLYIIGTCVGEGLSVHMCSCGGLKVRLDAILYFTVHFTLRKQGFLLNLKFLKPFGLARNLAPNDLLSAFEITSRLSYMPDIPWTQGIWAQSSFQHCKWPTVIPAPNSTMVLDLTSRLDLFGRVLWEFSTLNFRTSPSCFILQISFWPDLLVCPFFELLLTSSVLVLPRGTVHLLLLFYMECT